jgi:hypothetical protein
MKEAEMVQRVQEALAGSGIEDEIRVAGLFEQRGHSGSASRAARRRRDRRARALISHLSCSRQGVA